MRFDFHDPRCRALLVLTGATAAAYVWPLYWSSRPFLGR
jgi:hypothetical protein